MNAMTIVPYADRLDTALLNIDLDTTGIRIETVLHQFLDDRCRPLNYLAGGNLIDQLRR